MQFFAVCIPAVLTLAFRNHTLHLHENDTSN
jgi:hypothetical protein